jgi:hypothetical protein
MRNALVSAALAFGLAWATALGAAPLKLKPANPQPSGLQSGLNVTYKVAQEKVRSLQDARALFKLNPKRGKPLRGLDYRDTNEGEPVMTSDAPYYVIADISGYFRFDAPGVYDIEFYTNDGLDATIGGQRVGYFDGRQGCEGTTVTQVEVPQTGWYEFRALYYQNLGTSCLMMKIGPSGQKRNWVPNNMFGRK